MIRMIVNENSLGLFCGVIQECAWSNWGSPLSASVRTVGVSAEIRIGNLAVTSKKLNLYDLNKFAVLFEMIVMVFILLPILTSQ